MRSFTRSRRVDMANSFWDLDAASGFGPGPHSPADSWALLYHISKHVISQTLRSGNRFRVPPGPDRKAELAALRWPPAGKSSTVAKTALHRVRLLTADGSAPESHRRCCRSAVSSIPRCTRALCCRDFLPAKPACLYRGEIAPARRPAESPGA